MTKKNGTTLIIALAACCCGPMRAQGPEEVASLRILFAGDIMGHDAQIEAARTDSADSYDFSRCFRHLQAYIRDADIAVGNLEVTLAGPPYRGYPRFSSPDELGDALSEAGFDVLVNANNHALDRGKEGLERTVEVLGEKGLIQTGTFVSPDRREHSHPLILEKNGILLALLNYTYGTNGLVADTPNVVNRIDTLLIRQDIYKARLVEPDFIIACLHWGEEYQREENPMQQSLAGFLFDLGVDAVIGSHPHVVQPIRYERDGDRIVRPVAYSLGNFISNQRDRYRNGGIIVGLDLEKGGDPRRYRPNADAFAAGHGGTTRIMGIDYLPFYVHKPLENNRYVFELVPCGLSGQVLAEIGMRDQERENYLEFGEDTREHLRNVPGNAFYTGQE